MFPLQEGKTELERVNMLAVISYWNILVNSPESRNGGKRTFLKFSVRNFIGRLTY
jgi:hypothetical protein